MTIRIFEDIEGWQTARELTNSQRSCTEVKSQLYVALDQKYISTEQFDRLYALANKTHGKVGGFIKYLTTHANKEQNNQEQRTVR